MQVSILGTDPILGIDERRGAGKGGRGRRAHRWRFPVAARSDSPPGEMTQSRWMAGSRTDGVFQWHLRAHVAWVGETRGEGVGGGGGRGGVVTLPKVNKSQSESKII